MVHSGYGALSLPRRTKQPGPTQGRCLAVGLAGRVQTAYRVLVAGTGFALNTITVPTVGFVAIHSRKRPMTDPRHAVANSSAAPSVLAPVAPSPRPVEPATPSASSFAPINKGGDVPARVITRATNLVPLQDTADQLRAETADLRRAQAALHSGQATLALQLLNAQGTKYRSGLL